jgi:hypothetical protein
LAGLTAVSPHVISTVRPVESAYLNTYQESNKKEK